jgi:shikimate kinase
MGVGKSTVGSIVAATAGVPFVDLDAEVEKSAGKTISQVFAEDGEQRFRQLEREQLGRVLSARVPKVVALGGGALLRREVRLSALQRAVTIQD